MRTADDAVSPLRPSRMPSEKSNQLSSANLDCRWTHILDPFGSLRLLSIEPAPHWCTV
jgi:hypothetical protein